jgi:2-methylcitrate dehydratase PrpD
MTATLAQRMAAFAAQPPRGEALAELQRDLTLRLRDLVGVCLAALGSGPDEIVAALITRRGESPRAGLIGRRERVSAASAALHNGTLAHALDFDDTHLPSVLHPSASVLPATLAVAEQVAAGGGEFVHAAAVGEEICIRLGMAGYDERARDSVFFEKGLHATSICGTVGAAAAAGVLFGLDEQRLMHALAIAASFGAGLIEANRTGGSIKRVHCGWAASAGITAAELAWGGLTGPPTAFEGRFGFFRAFCDERARPEEAFAGLGEEWETLRLHYKPYPANHFTHGCIGAALELRRRGVAAEQIAEVRLGVPGNVLRTIAEPAAQKARPPDGYTARFSGPFMFATAMLGGGGLGVYLDDLTDESVRDPRRLALAARVRCQADERCDEIFPREFPAIAQVRTIAGEQLQVEILHNRGGPSDPLSDDDLALKFALNAGRALDPDSVARLDDQLLALPRLKRLDGLCALTAADQPAGIGADSTSSISSPAAPRRIAARRPR